MSQVLFQELVPLQVKCKDCEERCVPRYPVPAGGGWGPAKAGGGKEGGRWRLWPVDTCLRLGVLRVSRDAERVSLGTKYYLSHQVGGYGGNRRESMRKWEADPRQVNFKRKQT